MITALVTENLISAEALSAQVKSSVAGAVVTFSGDVRDHDKGKSVASLSYEIHPSAQSVIEKIANEVAAKHEVVNVSVAHRYGAIAIGESAFVVAVAAAHRVAADPAVALGHLRHHLQSAARSVDPEEGRCGPLPGASCCTKLRVGGGVQTCRQSSGVIWPPIITPCAQKMFLYLLSTH